MTLVHSAAWALPEETSPHEADVDGDQPSETTASFESEPDTNGLNQRCLALLAKVALGDHDAFTQLYEATTSRMWPLALRIVGQRQAAEDVLADLYFQVWRTAASYDPSRGAPLGWMTVMCRSRALDHLRRRDPAEPSDDVEALVDASSGAAWPAVMGGPGDDGDAGIPGRHRLDRLDKAMAGLSALRRQLLSMACFRGLSHSELALHFDLPLGTVKSHMRAALAHVRACLAVEATP